MQPVVSRIRAKRAKHREKSAIRTATPRAPWRERWSTRTVIGVTFWLLTVFMLGLDQILTRECALLAGLELTGKAVLLLVSLLASAIGMNIIRPDIMKRTSNLILLSLIAMLALIPARLVLYLAEPLGVIPREIAPFLIPFAIAPIAGTLLLHGAAGVVMGVWTALAVSLFADAEMITFFCGLASTMASASLVYRARTRSRVIRTGVIAGFSQILCVVGLSAIQAGETEALTILWQASACVAGGFLSAILALLILPPLERLFRITTNITLLELTDLGHPLLQRLALEAPGTYHHSLVVANLAQAAADEIGANSLLARVCAYFHDIGKLCKPGFFAENIRLDRNPHDRLPPSMSKLVITSHVKEGVSMALHHKLPKAIIDVIQEHHGTSLISYFHDKARTQLEFESALAGESGEDRRELPDWNFRYGGPRPSFPESAIICLADPVEAASRSMEKITPTHISALVDKITNARLEDGQLDESQLTLAQLARIKHAFVFTLTNMLHARTPYPRDEDRDRQSAKLPAPGPADA